MKLYLSRKEQYALAVLLLAILGALLVLSYAYGRGRHRDEALPVFEPAPSDVTAPAAVAPPEQTDIKVHVTGAVLKPGVYALKPDSRIADAIEQAGGVRANGYPDALNLAAKLVDGEKLYVPTAQEWDNVRAKQGCPPLVEGNGASSAPTAVTPGGNGGPSPAHSGPKPLPAGTISLNTATMEQLACLPGVGEVTAQKIIDYRTEHGKFTDIAQLLDVPRIGPKILEKIKPYLTL